MVLDFEKTIEKNWVSDQTWYDRLKDEMMAAEENTQYTYQKKKTLGLERKEAKMEKEEAEKYKKLQDSLADRQVELQLFKLYHNERKIGEYDDEAQAKRKEVDKIEKKKEKLEDKLKDVKKEQAKAQREFTKVWSQRDHLVQYIFSF